MPKTPRLKPDDLIRILLANGFVLDKVKGSHQIFINYTSKKRIVIPFHKKDLPIGTLAEIIKYTGIDKELFK